MEQMLNLRTPSVLMKTSQIDSSSSSREIIFAIEPTLWGEDRLLYDGAKMTSKMAQSLESAMK